MADSNRIPANGEVERFRMALDQEEQRCLGLQRQLDLANAEFEEFVSMAVHNLREPLRDVGAFSQLMEETHAGRLDAEGAALLQRIRVGAGQMDSVLASVVEYCAAANGERPRSRTDMQAVLCQSLLNADRQIADRGAVVTQDALPWVLGDFQMLAKVLHHLIRNAIEYCAADPPRVHISSRQADGDWTFSVRDNGPGIEPAFQNRIFGVFKRLHGKEYPGNGLGLAFCKKAVEWHGGRIWVESITGEGSTFYFALPEAD